GHARGLSVEVARARHQPAEERAVVDDSPGDEVAHLAASRIALPDAVDGHESRTEQRRAVALDEVGPDDDVDLPGVVLERHEDHALGGSGALPMGDEAARPRRPA